MMVIITVSIIIASVMLFARSIRANRFRIASSVIALVFACAVVNLTFGMSGLRAHAEQLREEGVSDEFVAGMIARDKFLFVPRVALEVSLLGLFIISIIAVREAKSKSSDSEDEMRQD